MTLPVTSSSTVTQTTVSDATGETNSKWREDAADGRGLNDELNDRSSAHSSLVSDDGAVKSSADSAVLEKAPSEASWVEPTINSASSRNREGSSTPLLSEQQVVLQEPKITSNSEENYYCAPSSSFEPERISPPIEAQDNLAGESPGKEGDQDRSTPNSEGRDLFANRTNQLGVNAKGRPHSRYVALPKLLIFFIFIVNLSVVTVVSYFIAVHSVCASC